MNQKLLRKVLATILAVILTFTNFIMLGIYTTKTYATADTLEEQNTVSNNENVKFDAYFMDNNKKTHTAKQDIDERVKLYLAINVEKGYLKNAKIQMKAKDEKQANFKISKSEETLQAVENVDIEKSIITLKQINGGTQVILEVPVESRKSEEFDLSDFNKINDIILTGSYVDNTGKTIQIEKTINTRNEWQKQAKAVVEQETKTYIPYEQGTSEGTILQTVVKTSLENNALPIKQTKISIQVPQINGKNPEEVLVISNNTELTKKQEENNNNEQNNSETEQNNNWEYNKETGILNIQVQNKENEAGKVKWSNTKDEYTITYKYKEKVETIQANQKAQVIIEAYNNEKTEIQEEQTLEIQEEQRKGNFVTTEITSSNEISKGYLYTKTQKEVEYDENVKLIVAYQEIIDKIIVQSSIDNFVNSEGQLEQTTINNNKYTYYKTTTINKENFEKILGQDGYIKIIGKNGEQLKIFTKETQTDENGNYVYEYTDIVNEIKIETSKPIQIGELEINHKKALQGKTNYTKAQIEGFQKLQIKLATSVEYAQTKIEETQTQKDIQLIAPSTKIETSVNKQNLSTVVKNENVEFRVILKTNEISCDLYKNPKIQIILPNYIKELNVKDVNLLFEDELKIKERKTYVNQNGNIVIEIQLEGEQTKYNQNEVSKGANIVVNTDITLKQLTPTKNDIVQVYVTNELATSYETKARTNEQTAYAEATLRAVAPVGMVTTSTITGYNSKNETVTSISGEQLTGKLEAKTTSKVATITMNVINNYENEVNNIKILGRMPVEANKDADSNVDLGSNLTLNIESGITISDITSEKYTIYYSENGEATKDVTLETNGWTTNLQDLKEVKSYLIVFNADYKMMQSNKIQYQYNVIIPANMEYNKSTYVNYVVYFNNIKQNETIQDKQVAPKIGLSTGEGPNLEVAIRTDKKGDIQEGDILTYTISVKNAGTSTIKNVKIAGNIPEGTTHIKYECEDPTVDPIEKVKYPDIKEYSETIEQLYAGEIKTITYQVEANMLTNKVEKTIEAKGAVTVENYDATFNTRTVSNKIVEGFITATMDIRPFGNTQKEGSRISYVTEISNVNFDEKENVVVTDTLPEGLTYESSNKGGVYDEKTRTVTWNLGKLGSLESQNVILYATVDNLKQGVSRKEIINTMKVKTNQREMTSNEVKFEVTRPILTINLSSKTPEKVSKGEEIEYNITIKNIGETVATQLEVKDYMPVGVLYRGATYTYGGKTYSSWIGNTDATISISSIKPGETVDILLKTLVEDIEENKQERKITNIVELSADDFTKIGSNPVSHTIVEKAESQDPTVEEPVEGTHKITGLAWLDSNSDGKRDDNEQLLSNIEVILVNSETGKIVQDPITNISKRQITNQNGMYTFANILPGKYLVVFLYDTQNFGVTTYKKDGVIESKNSDVISMNVTINGETKKAGVANSIQISNTDATNIDMGLIENPKFDLKLNKSVSKITVNTSKGAKVYEYDNAKLAKVDLQAKTIDGSTVIIEYKIAVTNEGSVPGYVKKIVDYMPKDVKFSSELNNNWYEGETGNLYNSSLANTLIAPGETKEVTLVLTKVMTSENTGTINNVAEIYEASNDLGISDIDSTPANKVQQEDDISLADVIIGVKTGEVYIYIGITLSMITLLGVGIYFINKKVLGKI